ncbi:VOC family protein [Sphingobacterium paramultivorum]|uniref:VOC family protein n=1 Tax=Sphingobacterium paramultivorum TaxID=2886510 RepID=A0A7G5E3W1_9SPHI|nr:VOC family protein [Sphingobacterium paramultivorum]QMV68686.1 VOC family protein [Sphingobacterium paramultivorum]WSO12448.1 VOC family protein [Sphingobacterium paramultivorum]
MRIEHLALWVDDLEKTRAFYAKYFGTVNGEKYHNPKKGFSSYFLKFRESGARLEIMNRIDITTAAADRSLNKGYTHLAISVGGKDIVDNLTEQLRSDGYIVESEPRTTGDGYYESAVLDPEGNPIEIVA